MLVKLARLSKILRRSLTHTRTHTRVRVVGVVDVVDVVGDASGAAAQSPSRIASATK
jgi:hypothetical protein